MGAKTFGKFFTTDRKRRPRPPARISAVTSLGRCMLMIFNFSLFDSANAHEIRIKQITFDDLLGIKNRVGAQIFETKWN